MPAMDLKGCAISMCMLGLPNTAVRQIMAFHQREERPIPHNWIWVRDSNGVLNAHVVPDVIPEEEDSDGDIMMTDA